MENDLISRQAAIDAVEKELRVDGAYGYMDTKSIVDLLNDLPSAQPEEDCDTCKHGYFGDDKCNNCRVRYPSHYERRTDEQTD